MINKTTGRETISIIPEFCKHSLVELQAVDGGGIKIENRKKIRMSNTILPLEFFCNYSLGGKGKALFPAQGRMLEHKEIVNVFTAAGCFLVIPFL